MARFFDAQGHLVSRYPWVAISLVLVFCGVSAIGLFIESGPAQDQAESFLPPDSELAQAQARIDADFATEATTLPVQVIFRGDVVTPSGFQEMLDSLAAVTDDAQIGPWLADPPAMSVPTILAPVLGAPGAMNPQDFQTALRQLREDPSTQALAAAAEGLLAGDLQAATGALAYINLDSAAGAPGELNAVQLRIEEILDEHPFTSIEGRSFSGAKLAKESAEAQSASTGILMMLALGVILVLLVVFFRSASDVSFTLLGLVLTIVVVFGLQGLLGPGGLGVIGADNPLAIMIPVLLIGLTVDYALQVITRYREELVRGHGSPEAIQAAVKQSGMPLLLAAGTTTISFLTNLGSALPPLQDFGLIAGIGVMTGWLVMILFLPSVRTLIDRRRERQGRSVQTRSMAQAIPGVDRLFSGLSNVIVRHPAIILGVVAVVSLGSFVAATQVSTTFSETDFLPEGTESYQDLKFLEAEFGGNAGSATLLVEADLSDEQTLRDLVKLEIALAGEATRPAGMNGPVQASFLTLAFDWADDSGLPGDKYDAEVVPLLQALDRFFPTASDIEALLEKLEAIDPDGFSRVIVRHDGLDRTILRIPVLTGDADATDRLVAELRQLWDGPEEALFITGGDILSNAVTQEMTDSQLQSVVLTIGAALLVLMVFFGITERQPMLGLITVLPIGLVVGWVLGSMFLLGISYNVMTALITALTIGVGVDYTIHVTHRFLEELEENRGILHAVNRAMQTTGGALLGSALTTALGFAVLVFSPLAPMQQFGGLTALTIVYSLVAAFLVLPPMLVLWALYQEWRDRQFVQVRLAPKGIVPADGHGAVTVLAQSSGRWLNCPRCATRCFVPHAVAKLRCPTCSFTGLNPRHQRPAPSGKQA